MEKDQTGCFAGRTRASVLAGRTASRASECALRLHLRVSTQPQRQGIPGSRSYALGSLSPNADLGHWGLGEGQETNKGLACFWRGPAVPTSRSKDNSDQDREEQTVVVVTLAESGHPLPVWTCPGLQRWVDGKAG